MSFACRSLAVLACTHTAIQSGGDTSRLEGIPLPPMLLSPRRCAVSIRPFRIPPPLPPPHPALGLPDVLHILTEKGRRRLLAAGFRLHPRLRASLDDGLLGGV